MKKFIVLLHFIFLSSMAVSQNNIVLDTIYANDKKNVALFFPGSIRQGIVGSDNFVFTYNREKQQYFGFLQATPGEDSNLLVITNNGQVYSYILSYATKVDKLSYFIDASKSVGNEKMGSNKGLKKENILASNPKETNTSDYQKLCGQLLRNPKSFDQVKQNGKISVKMGKSIYHSNEVYLVFEINNKSHIDFDINSLNLFKVKGSKKKKTSYQELLLSPKYKFNMPQTVRKNSQTQFVLVYSKFTLGNHEKLLVKLDELNGSRNMVLRLK